MRVNYKWATDRVTTKLDLCRCDQTLVTYVHIAREASTEGIYTLTRIGAVKTSRNCVVKVAPSMVV